MSRRMKPCEGLVELMALAFANTWVGPIALPVVFIVGCRIDHTGLSTGAGASSAGQPGAPSGTGAASAGGAQTSVVASSGSGGVGDHGPAPSQGGGAPALRGDGGASGSGSLPPGSGEVGIGGRGHRGEMGGGGSVTTGDSMNSGGPTGSPSTGGMMPGSSGGAVEDHGGGDSAGTGDGDGGLGTCCGGPGDGASRGTGAASGGSTGVAGGGNCMKTTEVCDGIDNDCDGVVDQPPTCPDGCTGFALANHGYMYCANTNDVSTAMLVCAQQMMHLAWLESAAENAAVVTAVAKIADRPYNGGNQAGPFIGGTDVVKEGYWFWGDGTPFWTGGVNGSPVGGAFSNWAHDEPNDNGTAASGGEDCIELLLEDGVIGSQGQWNDVSCNWTIYETLCERL